MNTVDEVLDYAIDQEQQAADFYAALAKRAEKAGMKQILLDFSQEEKRHKALLEEVRFLLVRASLVTSELGGQFVKFYSDYTLEYEISMDANVRINTREL